jgi:sterol desaturase/sphingolipid hydroxylase (fatty acid hydroxylase superfamily)
MENLGPNALIAAIVLPLFYLAVYTDYALSRWQGRSDYQPADTVGSLAVSLLMSGLGVLTLVLRVAIYAFVYQHIALFDWSGIGAWGWLLGLLLYDFSYYWQHRMGHEWNLLWASHVVHHSSERFNLATALRVPAASMNLWTWFFALPLAVLGVPPVVYAVASLLNLLYQFWIHTERVGSLGWFDRWFGSPSNHRVHHGVNDRYLDRNYGGILMCWDRMFGSFQPELDDDPVRYGTRAPVRSFNPIWINLHTPWRLLREVQALPRWRDRLRLLFHPPGWRPPSMPAAPAWQPADRFEPVLPASLVSYGLLQCFLGWPLLVQLIASAPALSWPAKTAYGVWLALATVAIGLMLSEARRWRLVGAWLEVGRLLVAGGLALAGQWFAPWPFGWSLDLLLAGVMLASLVMLWWQWRGADATTLGGSQAAGVQHPLHIRPEVPQQ